MRWDQEEIRDLSELIKSFQLSVRLLEVINSIYETMKLFTMLIFISVSLNIQLKFQLRILSNKSGWSPLAPRHQVK